MLQLAEIFGDHMVLQRNAVIKIFGNGKCSATAELGDAVAQSMPTENGWIIRLPPMAEGGPYKLKVWSDNEVVILDDIMIGDVWIASGQSNMEFPLFREIRGFEEAANAGNSNIRLYTCNRATNPEKEQEFWAFERVKAKSIPWCVCNEQSALHFSAIGYFIARELNEKTGIPIGIISANKGSATIESFLPEDAFGDLMFKDYIKNFNEIKIPDEEVERYFEEFEKEYIMSMDALEEEADYRVKKIGTEAAAAFELSRPLTNMKMCKYHYKAPSVMYNRIIKDQIAPMAVKGIIWYQGEGNRFDRNYAEKFEMLAAYWRAAFENQNMPFYTIEIAPFEYGEDGGAAYLRSEQWRASRITPHTFIMSTQDMGNRFDIHPCRKKETALRVANQILNYSYNIRSDCECPSYVSLEIRNHKAYIKLKNDKGFFGSDIGKNMKICGDDGIYYQAYSTYENQRLVVWSNQVNNPRHVRYCFGEYYAPGGYFNGAGLPLAPFATDIY